MQPARHRLATADRAGPASQDQERGLRSILGIVFVAQDLAADPQDHRPVAIDQGREGGLGGLVPTLNEPVEQLAVGESPGRPRLKQGFDLLKKFHRFVRCEAAPADKFDLPEFSRRCCDRSQVVLFS